MRQFKTIRYIFSFVLLALLLFSCERKKVFDHRITLKEKDEIPYGTKVSRELLGEMFPEAQIFSNKANPFEWNDIINIYEGGQAAFLIGKEFNADEYELAKLLEFAKNGNYVFISAKTFSSATIDFFGFEYNSFSVSDFMQVLEDSVKATLEPAVFPQSGSFAYPGIKYESYFNHLDTAVTGVLGRSDNGQPNFIQFNAGEGKIFIHISPISLSNYFVLHKTNAAYFERIISVIPDNVQTVLWNEYYLVKPQKKQKKPSWFAMLMKYPSFRWALLTAVIALMLFIIFGMRRQQRPIPVIEKHQNDSLDFVKTLGRLYYDRKDHKNLANKMGVYFFDNIRNRYKLNTTIRDETFVKALHEKSGFGEQNIREILDFIQFLDSSPAISERQLVKFHQLLDSFYQNT